MDVHAVLKEIGLGEGEVKVYLALLKLGSSPVSKINEECNLHRTTVYDFLEKLVNKGLISYFVENNVNQYKATDPNKLLDFIKEKERNVSEILPELEKIRELEKKELKVEVYRGVEGFKTMQNEILRLGENYCALGIDELEFKKRFPILMEQFFRREKKAKIKERLLTSEDASFVYEKETTDYRTIPKEFFNPTPTFIYGDKVAIMIWEPLNLIMIENKELADAYRKYFDLLWNMSKK